MTADDDAIRNLLASYHHFGDNHRATELAALFTPDGVLEPADTDAVRGREAIAAFLRARHARRDGLDERLRRSRHHLATVYVESITDSAAEVHSYFQVLTPSGLDHWGTYDDSLAREGTTWSIAHRRVRVEGQSPQSWRAK